MLLPINISSEIKHLKKLSEISGPHIITHSGLIDWTDKPNEWFGPFDDKYCFCKISDGTNVYSLKTLLEISAEIERCVKYSTFNLPPKYRQRFLQKEKLGHIRMTHQEYLQVERDIRFDICNVGEWETNIIRDRESRLREETYWSVERPIQVYLCGNDDCSYSQSFATIKEAHDCVSDLVAKPSWDRLKRFYGFKFTN